jgi:hypothetical protein
VHRRCLRLDGTAAARARVARIAHVRCNLVTDRPSSLSHASEGPPRQAYVALSWADASLAPPAIRWCEECGAVTRLPPPLIVTDGLTTVDMYRNRQYVPPILG